jgi:magnesium chelatase family protein
LHVELVMKLKSLILNNHRLEVAEVEIEFIPGIPQIHFLGLPDRLIKESFYRIKSALKNAGYKFPLTSQMIVNIKPNHLRKSSRGVELAVALGILLKTEQVKSELVDKNWIIYGELGLDGSVYEPSDLTNELAHFKNEIFLTGQRYSDNLQKRSLIYRLNQLQNFEINKEVNERTGSDFERPTIGLQKKFTANEAEFLFLAATSGFHGLLAGDSGAGKSTLAKSLTSFLAPPSVEENIRYTRNWRPFIAIHSSITAAAFLGGGASLQEGEIERVQGGVLVMDEFLQFDSEILESLRGPMTGETLRLSRGASFREIEAQFQVIATSNLCKCGQWTPEKTNLSCRFSRTICRKYLERLSGPILDRFALLLFVSKVTHRKIEGSKILERSVKIQQHLTQAEFKKPDAMIEKIYTDLSSRRRNYLDHIARIYAIERSLEPSNAQALLEGSKIELTFEDYNKAERWVIKPFEQLEKGFS